MKDKYTVPLFILSTTILVYTLIKSHLYIASFLPQQLQIIPHILLGLTILGFALIAAPRNIVTRRIVQFAFIWSVPSYILGAVLYVTTKTVIPTAYAVPLTILVSVYAYSKAKNPVVKNVKIVSDTPRKYRVAQITDIHLGDIWGEKDLKQIVKTIQDRKVDAVVITGDISDGMEDIPRSTYSPLEKLEKPVFFVTGNHDLYDSPKTVTQNLESQGITVLQKEFVELPIVTIGGIGYTETEQTFLEHADKIPENKPFLLLRHEPQKTHILQPTLTVSGHVHNGQIWPLKYFSKVYFTHINGLYNDDKKAVYVSSGTRTWGPPYRLGTQSEITIFTFIPSKK